MARGTILLICCFSVQEHFMEVIRNQEFVLLPASEIAKLLASDDMNIPNEETILNALLTWVRHDLEQRRKDLSKLLAYIRLPLLAPQVINKYFFIGFFFACSIKFLHIFL